MNSDIPNSALNTSLADPQIEALIREAENRTPFDPVRRYRVAGGVSLLMTLLPLLGGFGIVAGIFAPLGWLCTYLMWRDSKDMVRDFKFYRARAIWANIERSELFGSQQSPETRDLLNKVASIYEQNPQGDVLPFSQAVRLVLVWQQQQQRLQLLSAQTEKIRILRDTLVEKQKLLGELGDDDLSLEKALARLNADMAPIDRSSELLLASCHRLEAILATVDASARRRQLHREVGELAAQLTLGDETALQVSDEHLDLERQIGREIETFLELERETDAHLREL